MITSFDDYMIHQTAEAVNLPAQSDRNFYERHWMSGFDQEGDVFFEIGFGLYPNRRVMDGHLSVVIDNQQYAFHASRRAPKDRIDTNIGPMSLTIETPMRALRFAVDNNEQNISCDLRFEAVSIPHQEPHNTMFDDGHLIMHNTRFTQSGQWTGWVEIDGKRYEVNKVTGIRDKSWGVRPVGEPQGGAPGLLSGEPGVFWFWCPVMFGDQWLHYGTFEDREGNSTQLSCELVPLYQQQSDIPEGEDEGIIKMSAMSHKLQWNKGTRLASGAEISCSDNQGGAWQAEVEPYGKPHYMLGIGYNHPEWGHAFWQGELVTGREDFNLEDIDPLKYEHIHTHQRVKGKLVDQKGGGEKIGYGILETIVVGRHAPSGFKDLFDGAP